jgi:hypothetical protein
VTDRVGSLNTQIGQVWAGYGALVVATAGLLGIFTLLALLIYAKRSRKPVRPVLMWAGSNLALLLNAEGMWRIAVDTLHLPRAFAALVFAVFEITLTVGMVLASERYHATTERDPGTGKITKPGHPGKMIYVVWFIALSSALVVASSVPTLTETILRFVLPVIVVTMWWATLTAEGQLVRRSRFAHSPTRLAERWGWLVPDADPDFAAMGRQRRLRALVAVGYRDTMGTWPRGWHRWRLGRLARSADDAMVAEARAQVDRVRRIAELLATPVATGDATEPASEVATGDVIELATEVATAVATQVATEVASRLATELASRPAKRVATTPASEVATRGATVAADDLPESAKAIAKLRARNRDITQVSVMQKLQLSERTVQRYWAATTPPPPPAEPANGTDTSHLLPTGSR